MIDDLYKNGCIYIRWDSGEMYVKLDGFFPTTVYRTKKLLKLWRADCHWAGQDDAIRAVLNWFTVEIGNAMGHARVYQEIAQEYMNTAKSMKVIGKTDDYRYYKLESARLKNQAKQNMRDVVQLRRERDMIAEVFGVAAEY